MNIIKELLEFYNSINNKNKINFNKLILKKNIDDNLQLYKNQIINEIYPNNDFIKNKSMDGLLYFTPIIHSTLLTGTYDNILKYTFKIVSFKCIKTNVIAYSWESDSGYLLHPFIITNHKFSLTNVETFKINYICKKCNIKAFKEKNRNEFIFNNKSHMLYNCEEYMIKNLIE